MEKNLDIKVGATDDASGPFEKVRGALKGLIGSFHQSTDSALGMVKAGALLETGMKGVEMAFDAAKDVIRDTVGDALHYQDALEQMHAALVSIGDGSKEATQRAAAFAEAVENQTIYSREAVLQAQQLGATIGGFTGPSLQTATKAAIGLAQKLNIDLATAMEYVARSAHGQSSLLTRYGITFDKNATAQQKFNTVLKDGLQSFSLAQAQTRTLTGAWANFTHQIQSAVQDAMMPAIGAITRIAESLAQDRPVILAFGQVVGAVMNAAMSVFKSLGSIVSGVFGNSAGGMENILLQAAYTISHWKEGLTIDVLAVELTFVRLSNQVQYLFGTVMPTWIDWFAKNWKSVLTDAGEYVGTIFSNMSSNIVKIFENIPGLISGRVKFDSLWTPLEEGFKSTMAQLPRIAARTKGPLEQALGSALADATRHYDAGLDDYLKKQHAAAAHEEAGIHTGSTITVGDMPDIHKLVKHHATHHLRATHTVHHHQVRGYSAEHVQSNWSLTGIAAAFASAHQAHDPAKSTARNTAEIAKSTAAANAMMQDLLSLMHRNPVIAGVL
ncbi:MAG: hypothetical protein M0Z50_04710 [Planctomycetia bacterium]|nr:hypothetical protein [Planctomycetia bacterium]